MFEVEDLNPATEVGPAQLPWQLLHTICRARGPARAGAGAGAGAGARADLTRLASFARLAARATASTR